MIRILCNAFWSATHLERDCYYYSRSLFRHPCDTYASTDQKCTLFHSQQAERRRVLFLSVSNASPIVNHFQLQFMIDLLQFHKDVLCARVSQDIGQNFLKNSEDCSSSVATYTNSFHFCFPMNFNTGSSLKLLCLPFNCRDQPEII